LRRTSTLPSESVIQATTVDGSRRDRGAEDTR
jgi:hypothetical protein